MPAYRSLEEFIFGPDGDRKQGLIGSLPDIMEKAKEQKIKTIEIEIRKTPPGTPSTQEGTVRIASDLDPEEVATALLKRLQEAPGDSFKGLLRLGFREAGKTSNSLRNFEREMSGGVGGMTGDLQGKMVPYDVYHASLEDNRRSLDAGIRVLNAGANLIEKHMNFVQNLVNPQAKPQQNQDLLSKALGVMAVGMQDPAKGAAAAAKVLEEGTTKPIPSSGSSSNSPAATTDSSSKPAHDFSKEDAERWARNNPGEAREMALRLMQEGL